MHRLSGGCHCGNIAVELELPRPPDSYRPRACDCEFCRKHGAAWISDPEGSLRIRVARESQALTYRQGSGQAELLLCGSCGILAAALHRNGGRVVAAINARVLLEPSSFGSEQSVSPKTLSDAEKLERWQRLWFSNVRIL
jgi:hypothetical protein